MASSDYSKVTKEVREQIITNYLRQHPGIRRDQIVIRYENGKVVCEDITKSFEDKPSGLPGFDHAQLDILGKLENGGDKKYASGIQSLQASKEYGERLFKSNDCPFNKVDYEDNNDNLLRKQYQSAACALDVDQFKKKLDKQKQTNANPSEAVIRILMMEYFDTSTTQLCCLESIYTKEANLLIQYVKFASNYIRETYETLKERLDEKSVSAIKKALGILKNSHVNIPHLPSKGDIIDKQELKIYAERLHEFDQKLIPKRTQIQPVFKLVSFLEDKMKELQDKTEKRKATRMSLRRKAGIRSN